MASVDGRRNTDGMFEGEMIPCGPCQLSGIVKEADKFCRQCDDYMCGSCATIHTRFKVSRNHMIVPCSDAHSPGRRDIRRLPVTFCQDHQDKAIQWFCMKHDLMFCDICKHTIHRKCQVTSISDVVAGNGHQLADAIASMTSLKSRIITLRIAREKSVEDLEKLQESFEVEVEQFKSDIIQLVDRLGREILAEMKKVVSPEIDVILGHVKACDGLIPKVETELRTAEEARTAADDVTSVIAAQKLTKDRNSLEPTVSDMEQEVYTVNVTFQPSSTLADVVTGVDRFGSVNIDRTATGGVDPPMSASRPVHPALTRTSFADMAVASWVDINVPAGAITGSTITPDGRIVLVQKQIILLDNNLTIQSSLTLQGQPWDVAADGDNDVIVSMADSKKLQWIHVDGALRAGRTITTSHPCYGVAVHNGHIYISVCTARFPSTGHVQVLNRDGGVVRRIGAASGADRFTCPLYVTVGAPGTVYVADDTGAGRITCFTSAGDRVYDVRHNGMRGPCGMVADHDGNLLVCCQGSHDVHLLAKDGSHTRILLTSADGVARPYSMAYRRNDGTLIVTMGGKPYCRAYKLK